ncbi:hypothetical protein D3C85_1767020 [compost metagenome]
MGGDLGQQPEVALGIDPSLGQLQLLFGDAGTEQQLTWVPSLLLPVGDAVQGYPV